LLLWGGLLPEAVRMAMGVADRRLKLPMWWRAKALVVGGRKDSASGPRRSTPAPPPPLPPAACLLYTPSTSARWVRHLHRVGTTVCVCVCVCARPSVCPVPPHSP
jgi:hypothetical protein